MKRHELTCPGGIRRVYKGGVYHPTPSVFQRLEDEGIHVVDVLRFYPYRATFDFECFFDGENLPNATDHVEWVARHVPLSVSVASNVPGYEAPRCFVTDGDSNKLVTEMMSHLHAVSGIRIVETIVRKRTRRVEDVKGRVGQRRERVRARA